jgi:phosphoribosylformylglycinamidine synthase
MSKKVIVLQGEFAISSFRLEKINLKLSHHNQKIISCNYIYIVKCKDGFDQTSRLEQILNAKTISTFQGMKKVYVAPRIGTISPWSSKATDILSNCGFDTVERVEHAICYEFENDCTEDNLNNSALFDRMTESIYTSSDELKDLFVSHSPKPVKAIDANLQNLDQLDRDLGLALSASEKEYLVKSYQGIEKSPTDTELMMFAQANSEHCRHKIFNAEWTIDQKTQPKSLFSMIRNTEASTPLPAISAYSDNSAVFKGGATHRWLVDSSGKYQLHDENTDILIKVETHNHPTAISPFPGAATGSGGEIRDEAATGQGGRPKAGLTGFSVSHLQIPNHQQAWEIECIGKPDRISSAYEIMKEAPLGGAAFNNEFGRPNICGYFRNLEIKTVDNQWRGYHKPIMLAGGMGFVSESLALKQDTRNEDYLVVLGGPAMLIGLGGGAASSMTSGSSCENLDFASVQRGNPEMERRCQEVIDSCTSLFSESPIRSIHDVGAGGLSNAMPELLDDAGLGGVLELRKLQIDNKSMSPMEVWCNESQERYVLSIKPEKLSIFEKFCKRERCPYAVLGQATHQQQLVVTDQHFSNKPVDIPMELLFGKTPKTTKAISNTTPILNELILSDVKLEEAVTRVLNFPTVASKNYLITIGDRTVSGLVHRDQMVGPWQVPVADCGVTLRDYDGYHGEAMAIGEKAPLALISGAASARMAVSEAILNIAANDIGSLPNLKLSANWMAASGKGREDQELFEAVKAIGEELCPDLGIGIPVGKDSLSMHTQWQDDGVNKQITSPVSLIISAFAGVKDTRNSITPYFDRGENQNVYYIDLANGNKRLGASSLAQVYSQVGNETPDLEDVEKLKVFWDLIQKAVNNNWISSYHDISDGGIFVCLLEMAIASQSGLNIDCSYSEKDKLNVLFSEELGVVVTVSEEHNSQFQKLISTSALNKDVYKIGCNTRDRKITIKNKEVVIYQNELSELEKEWSQTSYLMSSHRDNPELSKQEFDSIGNDENGLNPKVKFDFSDKNIASFINLRKPKVAILREQGVNGQKEMAMAFYKAGFESYDVHMQDLMEGKVSLSEFQGLAACGGFSYGDVLGAGKGWANSILYHADLRKQFEEFFSNNNNFALGVCNGCQMLSSLKDLIPGAENWPQFLRNKSEQFEARFSSLKISDSNSIFFDDMIGAEIPVAIAHGEGRATFASDQQLQQANLAANYIENNGNIAQVYPFNPNGSDQAVAAVSNSNGNVLVMMPHPERVFRTAQMSWAPSDWQENSPWMKMFYNARKFIG